MLENVQIWVYGTTALVDTMLLFAVLERHNWRGVSIWLFLLAVGVWSWHSGSFVRQLAEGLVGPVANPVRWLSMVWMTFGLWLMPSAALHGAFRVRRHRSIISAPSFDPKLILCYLPLVMLWPMSRALASDPSQRYLSLLVDYHILYTVWLVFVSGVVSIVAFQTSRQSRDVLTRRFYYSIAASQIMIACLIVIFFYGFYHSWAWIEVLQTVVAVSPVVPALLFAYFVMRFQLLPLILERTLAYGAVVMGVALFHELVLREVVNVAEARYRLNFGVIEGIVVLTIILIYQPLRDRAAETLQSLLDFKSGRRSRRQHLAVQLAARAAEPVPELFSWFTETLHRSFGSDLGAAWLCGPDGRIVERAGASDLLNDQQVHSILSAISHSDTPFLTRYSKCDPRILNILEDVRAGAVLRFEHVDSSGLFLTGCRKWGQPPSNEDLHAMSLLVEQFGVTLHSSRLQATQLAGEQRLLQQEKLSTLGLIAGSLAHEIKNPLSTIKTITRVLTEDLGPTSPHAEDLRMITGEIERLSTSTSELLEAARPPRKDRAATSLCELFSPTLRLLQHLARERQAELHVHFPEQTNAVSFDQVSLREIVFNLVSNGLEAAGSGGRVCLTCRSEAEELVIEVHDSGPGFTDEQRSRLFEPFFTTKPTGTGLGLYIVARRVRELGGQIECQSVPRQGTLFLMRFPFDCGTPSRVILAGPRREPGDS